MDGSVIKFIILEDDPKSRKDIVVLIEKLMFKTNYDYCMKEYSCYNDELKEMICDCSTRKIYILDIELENSISGIEVAQEIRRVDWDSEIIFITSHDRMFETVHRDVLKVFDFIEKFRSLNKKLEKDIKLILDQETDYGKFCFVSDRIKMQVYFKDITHIYRDTFERKLIIKTSKNRFLVNMTIPEVLACLDSRFKQVHRACIVNTERVNVYSWSKGYFVLDTNEKVDLCSKNFRGNISD